MNQIKTIAIIVAAGKSERFAGILPKQFHKIGDKTILEHSISKFQNHPLVDGVIVVYNESHKEIIDSLSCSKNILAVVVGGSTRCESVSNALKFCKKFNPEYVLIHDAARPLVSKELIGNIVTELQQNNIKAVIPTIKIADTIKLNDADANIVKTIDREKLNCAQTPQGFEFDVIYQAHMSAKSHTNYTDDASLLEETIKVKTIAGEKLNFKITTTEDLSLAQILTNQTSNYVYRTGYGFDVHSFCDPENDQDSFITLCGIKIGFHKKLKGHSDADVALHAIVDALLGSIAKGDIGEHFPDNDPKIKGADSSIFLIYANKLLKQKGGIISNIDVTIICEEPKLSIYKKKMQENIANILEVAINCINVKATTTEKLGFTGRREGIAASAVATVKLAENV